MISKILGEKQKKLKNTTNGKKTIREPKIIK